MIDSLRAGNVSERKSERFPALKAVLLYSQDMTDIDALFSSR